MLFLLPVAALLLSSSKKQVSPGQSADRGAAASDKPKSPTEFVKRFMPFALQSQSATGVPAVFTIAQAGLESRWGKSAPGFNFFGIKAGSSWKGKVQKLKTWEVGATSDPKKSGVTDELIKVYAPGEEGNPWPKKYAFRVYGKFRAYDDAAEGFTDHARFLKGNKRYSEAFKHTGDAEAFARAIAAAGYATAPNYATELVNTIRNVRKVS